MEKVIEITNLSKSYGSKTIVDDVSLFVERGTIFGLLGLNGAGKSTIIECALGTKKISAGKVSILGLSAVKDRLKVFERVGVQFQDCAYPYLITGLELCEMTAAAYRTPQNYKELLDKFGLSGRAKSKVSELSGGERQRLFIVLALIPKPEIVFLDELTTGLDTLARKEVWRHLLELRDGGLTIFLTSHYMDEVEKLCDKIAVLRSGKLVFCGCIADAKKLSGKDSLEEAYEYFSKEGD